MRKSDRYHARPMWMVQEEYFARQRARERNVDRLRKAVEWGSYLAVIGLIVFFAIVLLNGGFNA